MNKIEININNGFTANGLYKAVWSICKMNGLDRMYFGEGDIKMPRVECADGWNVSIQAGAFAYSIPREPGADEYKAFELGYPSDWEPLLEEYAEDPDPAFFTKTVFPFTPTEVVEEVLRKHGGIVKITAFF